MTVTKMGTRSLQVKPMNRRRRMWLRLYHQQDVPRLHQGYTKAAPRLPPTIIKEMEEMILWLGFSQTVAMKLVDNQGKDSPWTPASLSDEDIVAICDVIHRHGGLVSGKTLDKGNQISVLATNNLKLTAFIFKTIKHGSKDYEIQCINSTSVLQYQHQ